ncbi:MAG: type III polyketide synthase [Pseudomonadota bacterium]
MVGVTKAYINAIATAVPDYEVHSRFDDFARRQITDRRQSILHRMSQRSGIERRYSVLEPSPAAGDPVALDHNRVFKIGAFPSTAERMRIYDREAAALAERAVRALPAGDVAGVTHLIVTSCTGFAAPGVDLQLLQRLGLPLTTKRTMVGFMGCYAAINGLRLAEAIVSADEAASVLVVSVELCTIHLQETDDLEVVLSFMVFGDGCAAALVTAKPTGFRIEGFDTTLMPAANDLITWHIGESGFDMRLSGEVPATLGAALPDAVETMVPGGATAVDLWAIHPGGRSVLDAAERALALPGDALASSRRVLREYGNMSSPSVSFVMADMLAGKPAAGATGLALAFGPGLTCEGMRFRVA